MWVVFAAIALGLLAGCVEPSQSTPKDPASIMESKNCGKPVRATRLRGEAARQQDGEAPPPEQQQEECP
jgi:hypothetical protein